MGLQLLQAVLDFWAEVERLLELELKMQAAFEGVSIRVANLETRMTYLEAAERAVVTEAKAAAGAAATAVAAGLFSEVVTRPTHVEIGLESAERTTLPPP